MESIGLIMVGIGLLAGLLLVIYLIAADEQRFVNGYDFSCWRDRYYIRILPNYLQALRSREMPSPWPRSCNAVAAAIFHYKVRRLARSSPAIGRKSFFRQHLTLLVITKQLRPFIDDFLLSEQQRIIASHLVTMPNTVEQSLLSQRLDAIRRYRAAFHQSLTTYDRERLVLVLNRKLLPKLRMIHAMFQEHGYSLLPEINMLRHWESLSGAEIAQELKTVPLQRAKRRRRQVIA